MSGGPRALGTTLCSSCHQPIVFVITPGGNRMPLDPNPDPDGNVWLDGEGMAHVVDRSKPPQPALFDQDAVAPGAGTTWYVSHFRTCPNASQHRKIRR